MTPQSRADESAIIHFGVLSITQPLPAFARWQPLADYDAATMCGVNYKRMSQKIKTGELVIVTTSTGNIIAARSTLAAEPITQLRRQLLTLDESVNGKQRRDKMKGIKIKNC